MSVSVSVSMSVSGSVLLLLWHCWWYCEPGVAMEETSKSKRAMRVSTGANSVEVCLMDMKTRKTRKTTT